METKTCKYCNKEKPLSDFSPHKKSKQGVNSKCKVCSCEEQTNRRNKDKELYNAKARSYRKNNPEKYRIIGKKYANKHPERKLLDGSKYRAKKLGILNTLTMDDIIVPEFCPILGIRLEYSKGKVSDCSPSIDRIDSTKGYVADNIHAISHKANRIKGHLTENEIVKLLNYIRNGI